MTVIEGIGYGGVVGDPLNDDGVELVGLLLFLLFECLQKRGDLLPASAGAIGDAYSAFASIADGFIDDGVGECARLKGVQLLYGARWKWCWRCLWL